MMTLAHKTFSDFFNESPLISRTNSVEFESLSLLVEASHASLENSLLIVLVGLPACGKSTVAKYLVRYLETQRCPAKIYNAGNVRRAAFAALKTQNNIQKNRLAGDWQPAAFFKENNQLRDKFAFAAFERCILDIINNNVSVGIFDATNSTTSRRAQLNSIIKMHLSSPSALKVVLLDVKCTNLDFWSFNMELKVSSSPDYVGETHSTMSHKEKLADFVARTKIYIQNYEPVLSEELDRYGWDYIMLDNGGENYRYRPAITQHISTRSNNNISEAALKLALEQSFNLLAKLQRNMSSHSSTVPSESASPDEDPLSFSVSKKHTVSEDSESPSISSYSSTLSLTSLPKIDSLAVHKVYQFISHYYRTTGQSYLRKAKRFRPQVDTAGSTVHEKSSNGFACNTVEDYEIFKSLFEDPQISNKVTASY